jgi:hypothetical protein
MQNAALNNNSGVTLLDKDKNLNNHSAYGKMSKFNSTTFYMNNNKGDYETIDTFNNNLSQTNPILFQMQS